MSDGHRQSDHRMINSERLNKQAITFGEFNMDINIMNSASAD